MLPAQLYKKVRWLCNGDDECFQEQYNQQMEDSRLNVHESSIPEEVKYFIPIAGLVYGGVESVMDGEIKPIVLGALGTASLGAGAEVSAGAGIAIDYV